MHSLLPSQPYVDRAVADGREGYYAACRWFLTTGRLRGPALQAFRLHSEGHGFRAIGAAMGVSKRKADELVSTAKKAMASYLEEQSDRGDRGADKGDKPKNRKNARKIVMSMISDLEHALWQTTNHRF